MRIAFLFPTRTPKPKLRKKGSGTARAQLAARDPHRGVIPLGSGSARGFMSARQYRASKRVWPG